MFANSSKLISANPFANDTLDWFLRKQHGHMGKWQYLKPDYDGDPCRGDELWDVWENLSQDGNMLNRQKQIIKDNAESMAKFTGPIASIIDLGPGGDHAVLKNTIPFIQSYSESLVSYTAIDMNEVFAKDAATQIKKYSPNIQTMALAEDFYREGLSFPYDQSTLVLFNGGTIGNFQAEQNTPKAIALMAGQLKKLKNNMPVNSYLFVGLEATQDADILYGDYNHPAHAVYEINVMHGIKRDLLPDEDGFDPDGWKYAMKWWPDAHQFCHLAEVTKPQKFSMHGQTFEFSVGDQLVIDNSFKFPVLAMQRAAQMAGVEYLRPYADKDGRMVVHALIL